MVQVMCETCEPFDISEELCADILQLAVDEEMLALVARASRRVGRAGGCLKITSVQEMLALANDEKRLQEGGS